MKIKSKRQIAALLLAGLMFSLSACGKADAVKEDLYIYLTDMADTQNLQKAAINEYNVYVADEEADSQQLLSALRDSIIPKYEEYLAQLDAVPAETPEVQEVKAICVDGAKKQLNALSKVAEAIEACDTDLLNEADSLIVESESLFSEYESQLNALAVEHEITLVDASEAPTDSIQETE